MSTPQSTPVRHVKLGIVTAKWLPLTNEYKKLLGDQHQRLSLKHQQDLDLLDDIRAYVKARLSIEKDYTNALQKLAKHHLGHINKRFVLLGQLDQQHQQNQASELQKTNSMSNAAPGDSLNRRAGSSHVTASAASCTNTNQTGPQTGQSNSNSQQSTYNSGNQQSDKPSSLYKVWFEHVNRLQSTAKNRSDQFEQLIMIADKLKDIRQHKASIGKKCLETHLRRIQEDLLASMMDVERAKKLYYEDESQAKKARENEERIKKKRTGLLTKFTDLQAKKEKSSAQREATDIQSTQARNDYIMALAAANAHLNYYCHRDLNDFIHLIDDGVLDHCKIFMATLSECDINSLKDTLQHAQYWSKLINLTGSQQTNYIFLECEQSKCLRTKQAITFEACNNDPIQKISLEHNADYALQHEIDKWFTWFKKECRNLSQLMHQLDTCQHAFAEGKKSIELNGQTVEDLEPKIIDLKQQIRKCEAAKLKAQARLKAIKEGGMQIEEWSDVELEIRADMARAQEEQLRAQRLKELKDKSLDDSSLIQDGPTGTDEASSLRDAQFGGQPARNAPVHLQVSRDSDDDETRAGDESMHNLASVSRSTSNLGQKQQNALTGYSALTDPSLVWQDDYSSAWGGGGGGTTPVGVAQPSTIVVSNSFHDQQQQPSTVVKSPTSPRPPTETPAADSSDPLSTNQLGHDKHQRQVPNANMSIQSSSPLSAIVNGGQHQSQSPYQVGIMSEAYKSDYECDYTRTGHVGSMRSAASSAEPTMFQNRQSAVMSRANEFADSPAGIQERADEASFTLEQQEEAGRRREEQNEEAAAAAAADEYEEEDVTRLLNERVIALYTFEKNNEDDLAFNEHDVLTVIETNPADKNWIKARLESNGEEGFIPSSYVRRLAGGRQQERPTDESNAWRSLDQQQSTVDEASQRAENDSAGVQYCRAVYDYTPEANTFEEDGLPHLALKQGELMRVIDQGADDGWWLVEKETSGTRGHVPSMLVDEVDPNEEEDDNFDDGDDFDEGDVSDRGLPDDDDDDDDEATAPRGAPPSFEPPILEDPNGPSKVISVDCEKNEDADEQAQSQADQSCDTKTGAIRTSATNSLIPTAFIIIEPTPEVESRKFEDNLVEGQPHEADENNNEADQDTQNAQKSSNEDVAGTGDSFDETHSEGQKSARQIVHSKPSSQVSYSVVNEDFILEKPTRKPYQHCSASGSVEHAASHHHEPTIEEVDDRLEQEETADNCGLQSERPEGHEAGRPEPPSVVIDSVEALPRSPDLSFDEGANGPDDDQDASIGADADSGQHSDSDLIRGQFKHTGNVDVDPILRHHADEFCKQLIEEAILLAPGSRIGPSTSSASVGDEEQRWSEHNQVDYDDEDEEDEEDEMEHDQRRNYILEDSM